jgi:hypothetical protein
MADHQPTSTEARALRDRFLRLADELDELITKYQRQTDLPDHPALEASLLRSFAEHIRTYARIEA